MHHKVKKYYKLNDYQELAYSQAFAEQKIKKKSGVVFLSGLKSDMDGTKAIYLHKWALENGISFLRFDYRGHGKSSGSYEDTSLSDWFEDSKEIIFGLTKGPQVLVGSSLGGWLSLLFAESYPEKVSGIVGIAAAPDFREKYKEQNLDEEQRIEIKEKGKLSFPSEYFDEPLTITKKLIDDGNKNLILKKKIKITCPIRLFQGTEDKDVDSSIPLKILEKIQSTDVSFTLVKNVDHRFSSNKCLFLIQEAITEIISY